VCADRDPESAEDTVRRIIAEGGQASEVVADITDPASVEAMVAGAQHELGGLDGVVYNVGIDPNGQDLERAPEQWDLVMNINLRGAMLTARAAVPILADGAAFVFISSVSAFVPGSRMPVYDASKAALGGLVRHIAVEVERRSIRANIVAPGLMDTALGRMSTLARPSRALTPVPLGRQGTAWETAYAVLFLLSDESAYITGQTLVVDGGWSALR
jgi:NAD(P)-dependent dehydrogenase (short-subunit alcohol dehydrogenase family)